MSYIRSGSNPEGLYIWGDGTNVHVTCPYRPRLSSRPKKKTSGTWIIIPSPIFKKALAMWRKNGGGDQRTLSYRGLTVSEKFISLKTGKPVSYGSALEQLKDTRPCEFQIKLEYKGQFVYMWDVTWSHIVNTN